MRQPIYNLERQKSAIFLNLRTFEAKNPLFLTAIPREPKTTIPEKFILIRVFFLLEDKIFLRLYK